jgi:hypothetical protein
MYLSRTWKSPETKRITIVFIGATVLNFYVKLHIVLKLKKFLCIPNANHFIYIPSHVLILGLIFIIN